MCGLKNLGIFTNCSGSIEKQSSHGRLLVSSGSRMKEHIVCQLCE